MLTKSTTSQRRSFAYLLALLLLCASFSKGAEAQATAPLAIGSIATSLTAPSGLGTVEQTALDSFGDWLVLDYPNGALYEYPAGGAAMITLAPPGTLGGVLGYDSDGITLDSMNNIYLDGNFSNCMVMFPYDTTTKTWDGFSTLTTSNTGPDQCGTAPYSFAQYGLITPVAPLTAGDNYFQPWGLATLPNNVLAVADQKFLTIFTLPVTYPGNTTCSSGNCSPTAAPGQATFALLSMTKRANSVAADKFGNIYFVEDSGGLSGAYMIPAGQTNVPSDTSSTIVRVDPNLPSVTAVATDANGNVYISDSTDGVYMVPNPSGTPNTASAVLLTPVPATGQVSVDLVHGILYFPTTNGGLTKVTFNAQLGSTSVGTPTATATPVQFSFNGAATPASFAIQDAGTTTPSFATASGGTCAAGMAYAAQSGCTENVTFDPLSAGNSSAKLLALGASGNILGSITLQGTGTGSAIQVLPGGESVIGAGLKTPKQVAVDAAGNTYVADSGLGAVEMYPKGYGAVAATTKVGTGLTAPTGVAVDGAGDVFIADSGNAIEVPMGSSGLNTAGQITLKSGLGTKLQLAIGIKGSLYISDPDNHRVVKLANPGGSFGLLGQTETDMGGFNAPSAIAMDASGDLYVADGSNLYEVTPAGVQSTLLTSLSNATGLAVDPSGSVYVATSGGTVRIPNISGTLTASAQAIVANNVTDPTSVAIDSAENLYITDGTAEDIEMVSSSASTNFGTLTSTTGSAANSYTVLDAGNAPLSITGFADTPDYTATSSTCVGTPIAIDSTCPITVTFSPGPGDQGTLTGEVLVQSSAANTPVGVNVTGVGAPLAGSTTTVKVTNATVDGAPAAITVAPASGTGAAPTGQVTLTITGTNLTTPLVGTDTLASGAVTINAQQLPVGSYTFSVAYQGDRTYGASKASVTVTVGVGVVTLVQPSMAAVVAADPTYPLVPSDSGGNEQPYDSSTAGYFYSYPISIVATDGDPLIAQIVTNPTTGKVSGANYGSVTFQVVEVSPVAGGLGGGATCAPVNVGSNGTAPFPTDCLAIDTSNAAIPDLETTYTVTPVYSPAGTGSTDCPPPTNTCVVNPNYSAVTGTPITFTALRNPVVQISSSPSTLTASASSPATATLTLTSLLGYGYAGGGNTPASGSIQEPSGVLLNNYSLPVQLACDGLPAYATCTFTYPTPDVSDPNSVAVGPAPGTIIPGNTTACAANVGCVGPGTVIMTITTNVPAGVAGLRRGPGTTTFATLFGLGLLGFAFGKKKSGRGRVPMLLSLLLCCGFMAAIVGISGCSSTILGTNTSTNTPAKTYTVSITAKQVGSRTVPVSPSNPEGIVYGNENQMSLPYTVTLTVQ